LADRLVNWHLHIAVKDICETGLGWPSAPGEATAASDATATRVLNGSRVNALSFRSLSKAETHLNDSLAHPGGNITGNF
jgi:hypothetical protein